MAASAGQTPLEQESGEDDRAIAEYLVRLAPGTEAVVILEALAEHGPTIVHDLGRDRYLVRLSSDPGPDALSESIQIPILDISPSRVYRNPRPVDE